MELRDFRFLAEDLHAVVRGFDIGEYASGCVSLEKRESEGLDVWRSRLVARLRLHGFADAAGAFCPELELIGSILRGPAVEVSNASGAFVGRFDRRRFDLVIKDGHAVLVRRVKKRPEPVFTVEYLGDNRAVWNNRFVKLMGLAYRYTPAPYSQRIVLPKESMPGSDDIDLAKPLRPCDEEPIEALAVQYDFDPMLLLDFVRMFYWSEEFRRSVREVWVTSTVGCECVHRDDDDVRPPLLLGRELRVKRVRLYPSKGLSLSYCASGREGFPRDWLHRQDAAEESSFLMYEWTDAADILSAVLGTCPFPEHFYSWKPASERLFPFG